jgi:hypothetical protein
MTEQFLMMFISLVQAAGHTIASHLVEMGRCLGRSMTAYSVLEAGD